MNTRSSRLNRSRRWANSRSSTRSLVQRGANGVRASCSVSGNCLAEPGHRPVEVVQLERLDAGDPVVLAPTIGGAGRSRHPSAGAARSGRPPAPARTRACARLASSSIAARQPVSAHSRSNTKRRPDPPHRRRRGRPAPRSPPSPASRSARPSAPAAPTVRLPRSASRRPRVAITRWRTWSPTRRLSAIWR